MMKRRFAFGLAAMLLAPLAPACAQHAEVVVDRIDADKSISGHVYGLSSLDQAHSRVVVYVHTDIWYIHPYPPGQGRGRSWAGIDDSGKWSISTIRRQTPADQIAVLVIDEDVIPPEQTRAVERILNIGMIKQNLRGTEDFGKL